MIIRTPEELRQYLPAHNLDNLDGLQGFIDNSEHDFLMERIGAPLYQALLEHYEAEYDKEAILPGGDPLTPWQQLVHLCQRPVAFDAYYRAADVQAVSTNASGLNIVSTEGYEAAEADIIDRYKKRLNQEAHRGIDRLLTTLEEWAQEVMSLETEMDEEQTQKYDIITLWRESRYYYLADGLFINTARTFQEFVDIYDSREKFIQLLPDLRYVSEFVLRPEVGDALMDNLLQKHRDGTLSPDEQKAVRLAQYALALKVEDRSPLFKRPEAKDEALGAMRRLVDWLKAHQSALDAEAVQSSPFYEAPQPPAEENPAPREAEPWKNNRKGNKLFVTRAIE